MQDHLVGKHPFGKLRIFRGADGSAVIREKGAYGNHMVEVGNLPGEVEVASLATEVTTTKASVGASGGVGGAGVAGSGYGGLGAAASQLNQAAQLATGLSLWNMGVPTMVPSGLTSGLLAAANTPSLMNLQQQLAANSPSAQAQQHQQQDGSVINVAPLDCSTTGVDNGDVSRDKLLTMSPEAVLGLIRAGRFPAAAAARVKPEAASLPLPDDEMNGTNGHTTDSETTATSSPLSLTQMNGSVSSPSPAPPNGNGASTAAAAPSRGSNRRKAAAPSHIRQRYQHYYADGQNGVSAGNGDAGDIVDSLVDDGALYRCDACNILFPEYSVYVLHLGCHGSGNAYECHFCKVAFDDKFGFLTHFTKCVKSETQQQHGYSPSDFDIKRETRQM